MLSVTQPNGLTRAEHVAEKAAYFASKRQPLFMIGVGVLAIVVARFTTGSSRDTLVWMGIAYAAIAWMTYEHWGFSNLLERRDAEIRQLKEAIRG
jgi:hypothetical protein